MNLEADAVSGNINKAISEALNIREIYRYMGYRGAEPDENIKRMTVEVLEKLIGAIEPKNIYKLYDCQIDKDTIELYDAERNGMELTVQSNNLADNLRQCEKVVLIAATLGIGADKLLNKYEVLNMARASIAQACGAACIEAYCDILQQHIGLQAADKGFFMRPRFSPGYGDLPLETQRGIFRTLECTKRIGLTLTESLLMYPTKSVTAFIGLTTNAYGCHVKKCSQCSNIGCEFRNE